MNLTNQIKNLLISFMLILVMTTVSRANVGSTPVTGDIAFIGFNADGNDDFAILVINDIPASTIIYFTDNEYNAGSLNTTEGNLVWTTPASVLSAGSVIIFSNVSNSPSASQGTLVDGTDAGFSLAIGGDVIYAYMSDDDTEGDADTFLAGITNHEDQIDGTNGSVPTGLSVGFSLVQLANGTDGGEYNEANGSENTPYHLLELVNNGTNWTVDGDDGTIFIPFNGFSGFTILTSIIYDGASWSNTDGPDASGRVAVTLNGSFTTTESLSLTSLTVNSGTLTADHALTIGSDLSISGASLNLQASSTVSGNLDITSSGLLTITSGNRLTLSGNVTGDNTGSFIINNGGGFLPDATTSFTNQTVQMTRNVSSSGYSYVSSPMVNYQQPGKVNEYYFDATESGGENAADDGEYGNWIKIDNGDLSEDGRGYLSYRESNITWSGSPNTGDISVPMLGTNGSDGRNLAERGWNLVGNPYTFPIDIALFTAPAGNDINANVYFWDPSLNSGAGGYTITNTGTIPSGQAFFIKANDGENSIDFTMAMDAGAGDNSTANYRDVDDEIATLDLEFDFGNGLANKLRYQFGEQFSDDLDRFDAFQFGLANADIQVSNKLFDSRFVGLTFKNINDTRSIPIEINTQSAGEVTIKVTGWSNVPEGTAIELVNSQTKKVYPLKGTQTVVKSSVIAGYSTAFELRFSPIEITGLDELSKSVKFSSNADEFIIDVADEEITRAQLNVFTIDGRFLLRSFYSDIEGHIEINSNQRGMFIVQLVTNKGTFSGKILK